jgi:hypothetical protein
MKKIYVKNSKTVIEEHFDSLTEYIAYIDAQPFSPKMTSRTSEKKNEKNWSGTDSYAQAKELCLHGDYSDKFNELLGLKDRVDSFLTETRFDIRQICDVIGYAPHVPNYLKGYPLNMINSKKDMPKESDYISVFFNVSQLATYTERQFYHKGVICLSLIEHLEKNGYRVTLKLFAASYSKNQAILTFFNLKRENERLDLRNLFFPMTNVAFLRRLHFRLREKTPELESHWSNSYGYSMTSAQIREFMEVPANAIIFSYPNELGIEGKSIIEDAKKCLKNLKLENVVAME